MNFNTVYLIFIIDKNNNNLIHEVCINLIKKNFFFLIELLQICIAFLINFIKVI